MTVQILVATMEQLNFAKLVKRMNIHDCIIINQVGDAVAESDKKVSKHKRFVTVRDKGLSRSRNLALSLATADICILADDDVVYDEGYESKVVAAFERHPDADIIAFDVNSTGEYKKIPKGRISRFSSMKLNSVRLAFRRKSVQGRVGFDNNFGAGTEKYMGEENIFLLDAMRAGLCVYYVPIRIAELTESDSSWFRGYNKEYFEVKGSAFRRMMPIASLLLALQFVIRKRNLYKKNISTFNALSGMLKGIFSK